MRINNEFTVHAPIDRAWALLTDVEAIAPCMPGAQLTGIRAAETDTATGTSANKATVGEIYEGKVKVKLGPVVAEYQGTAAFIEKDDEKHRGVIDAKGRDRRGAGNASAMITVELRADGDGTTVAIDTELKISGKIAQFGAGMIQEVSEKLLGQFVGCLEGKLAAPAESAPATTQPVTPEATQPEAIQSQFTVPTIASSASEPTGGAPELVPVAADLPPTITPATAPPAPVSAAAEAAATKATAPAAEPARRTFQASPEPEALDLLDLAGGAAFKRMLPIVIAGAAVVAAVIFYLTRR